MKGAAALLTLLLAALSLAACAARGKAASEPSTTATATPPDPGSSELSERWRRESVAFAVNGRLQDAGQSRRLKMRFYAQAPDRFRIEVRGAVGGIALVGTGEQRRVRIVVPSKRIYAEGTLDDEIGSGLVGIPVSGCDLAMVMRISSGMARFRPCSEQDEGEPTGPTDRPGVIVDTTPSGEQLVQFAWDWSDAGALPKEMRIILPGDDPERYLALTEFAELALPERTGETFFWEPPPSGAKLVAWEDLASGSAE